MSLAVSLAMCLVPRWAHGATEAAAPTRAPVEAFFQFPITYGAALSPNGRRLALSAGTKTHPARLVVLDLHTLKSAVVASFDGEGVGQFRWVNDERLVFNIANWRVARNEVRLAPGLFAVDHDGANFRQLVETTRYFVRAAPMGRELLPWNTHLYDSVGKQDGPEVFVLSPEQFSKSRADYIQLQRLNTLTGRAEPVDAPLHSFSWVIDPNGQLQATTTQLENRSTVQLRQADGSWRQITEGDSVDGLLFIPRHVGRDGELYVTSRRGRDTTALFRYDSTAGALVPGAVLQSNEYDIRPRPVATDKALLGWRLGVDAEVTHWLDADMKATQAHIDTLLPYTANQVSVARRATTPYLLVTAEADVQPTLYYLYHVETRKLTRVGAAQPEIDPRQMGRMEMHRYKARDGLSIPTYLTLPPGGQKKNLPLVVLVHGGPWVRGATWHWQREVQFLASRGYAVLQPEFRGSTGFGYKHFRAGWKQWGLAMQNDLADGARWAIAQGVADPKRICIAGASYGGYAAMMGLVNDPELFRCGINWVGVTDIDLMYSAYWSDISDETKRYGMPRMVGDRDKDAAQLKATSPLANAARITQPVLMAYGGADQRVPLVHGEKLRDALKGHNPQVEWIAYADEGHGWIKPETNADFWSRVERFLHQHIGAP